MNKAAMMDRLYWIITASFLGLAVYLLTILYYPSLTFHYRLNQLTGYAKNNSFFLMKPETQSALVAMATSQDVIGLCLVDVRYGKVSLAAQMPYGQWALTIYSDNGEQVYSLNDIEAGTDNFTVEISTAKGIIEQLRGKSDKDEAGQFENYGWHATLNGGRGVAVLWVPVTNPARRMEIQSRLSATRCEKK